MRTRSFILFTLFTAFLACKPKERIVEIEVPSLPVHAIYEADTVLSFLATVDEDGRKLGKSYLEKAREAKGKNPEKATYYYKRSLTLHPEYEVYMEFNEFLEEVGNYREQQKIFGLLFDTDPSQGKYPFKKPDFETYIDYVVNFTRTGNIFYYDITWQAESLGFKKSDIRKALLADERIPFEKNSKAFRLLEMNFMEDDEYTAFIQTPEYMEFFIHSFDVATQWTLDEKTVSEFSYLDESHFGYEGTLYDADFSSLLPCPDEKTYQYNLGCRLLINSDDIALIYSIDNSEKACPKDMRFVTHYIAFFDTNHVFLRCMPVAWQSDKELVTARLSGIHLIQDFYSRTWEKPFNKKDFDNRLVKTELVRSQHSEFDEFLINNKHMQ